MLRGDCGDRLKGQQLRFEMLHLSFSSKLIALAKRMSWRIRHWTIQATREEASVMANSQATQGTEVNQATEVDQSLSYNYKDKKLIWNGSVNDLETFLRNKFSSTTEHGNSFTINRINCSTNTRYTIFNSGYVTVNFIQQLERFKSREKKAVISKLGYSTFLAQT